MGGLSEVLGSMQSALLWICTIAAMLVFAAMVYSTVTFRADNRRVHRVAREFAWALVPILIVVAAAAPSLRNAAALQSTRSFLTENLDGRHCALDQLAVAHEQVSNESLPGTCAKNP